MSGENPEKLSVSLFAPMPRLTRREIHPSWFGHTKVPLVFRRMACRRSVQNLFLEAGFLPHWERLQPLVTGIRRAMPKMLVGVCSKILIERDRNCAADVYWREGEPNCMTTSPGTRDSLLGRVGDWNDRNSWTEFVEIYSPMIYRVARHQGMQHCDADDLTQSVLVSVSQAIGGWQRDPQRGGFRSWLGRVTRNAIINALTRGPKVRASGGTDFHDQIVAVADSSNELDQHIDQEYRRSLLRMAADRVRPHVDPSTWDAFWKTAIEQRGPDEVASELEMSVGAVYCAKARVMRRLKRIAKDLNQDWLGEGDQSS